MRRTDLSEWYSDRPERQWRSPAHSWYLFSGYDSGKIEFSDLEEAACSNACTADAECSEYTGFQAQSNFSIVINDGMATGKIQANASTSPSFDPVVRRGSPLSAFTGTMRYFSGGQQFTIEARCSDDIVDQGMSPMPSSSGAARKVPCGQPSAEAANANSACLPSASSGTQAR